MNHLENISLQILITYRNISERLPTDFKKSSMKPLCFLSSMFQADTANRETFIETFPKRFSKSFRIYLEYISEIFVLILHWTKEVNS